jgi:hypothetical protein
MHSPCNLENGLEANAFLTNVTVNVGFGALADIANGRDIRCAEAVLIRIDDDLIFRQPEAERRNLSIFVSNTVTVVFGILDELIDESGIFLIQVIRESNTIVS